MSARAARARVGRGHLALALGFLVLATGCRRKAPGPEECRDFAYRAVGVRSDVELQMPGASERVDDLTTECLLTPYDRELIACVAQGAGTRLCMREFAARNAGLAAPPHARHRRRDSPFP